MSETTKLDRLNQLATDAQALREKIEAALAEGDISLDQETVDALLAAQSEIEAAATEEEAENDSEDDSDGVVFDNGVRVYAEGNTVCVNVTNANLAMTSLDLANAPLKLVVSGEQIKALADGLASAGTGALVLPISVI
jgi:regulator of replication initiation timing